MKDQKKWELLKFAYDNYPKGTVYTWAKDTSPRKVTSSGKFYFKKNELDNDLELHDEEDGDLSVFNGDEWAEIVKTKIAVRVENEKEFNSLMKYYDSLGWNFYNGKSPLDLEMTKPIIEFVQGFYFVGDSSDYQIIPFSDFAKEKGIKLPLIKSEDGVWLCEGDEYCSIYTFNGKWVVSDEDKAYLLRDENSKRNSEGDIYSLFLKSPNHYKAFSTKQSALDWIEAQKPKKLEIKLNCDKHLAIIDKDWVMLRTGSAESNTTVYYKHSDIEAIHKAMQDLS